MARIEVKVAEGLIDPRDAGSIKADLVCRIKRSILNLIQADKKTPWAIVKERLKKAYEGGRWTSSKCLGRSSRLTGSTQENFLPDLTRLRTRCGKRLMPWKGGETGKKDGLPKERTFIE